MPARTQSIKRTTFAIIFASIFPVLGPLHQSVSAQTDLERVQNLATCLSGRYPTLCNKQWLSSEDMKKVIKAEYRENLKICLTGRYPTLCNKGKLSTEEIQQVVIAEKRENLKTCLTGRYKTLCKKDLLTNAELKKVVEAEQTENLRTCLTGRFPSLCDKSILTKDQLTRTQSAENRSTKDIKQYVGKTPIPRVGHYGSSGCESHWIESVSDDGEIVKLEDGSIWQVDPGDTTDSALWLPTTDIVACDDKLINTDDNETVSATRIR